MNLGKATAIFEQINSDKYRDIEKLEAIKLVSEMPTHNGIRKDTIIEALRWLIDYGWEDKP